MLLTEYVPGGSTISDPYYASIIDRLRCAILEKCRGKVVLLDDGYAPVDKCNIVQVAIRKTGFVDLNHPAYSPDIAPSDYYIFSNLKKVLRGKNFSGDDATLDTVEENLNNFDLEFLYKGIYSLCDRW